MALDMGGFPVTRSPAGVGRAAAGARDLAVLDARVSGCRACPRLVAWREEVAQVKRAAFRDED
jgi:uracil-DNA glycosylase